MALIDRTALFNRLSNRWDKAELYEVLNSAEEVDAVPVVHAKWIHTPFLGFKCSECGNIVWSYSDMENIEEKFKRFCPVCGARMDVE